MNQRDLIHRLSANDPNTTVVNLSCCHVNDEMILSICHAITHNTYVHSLLFNWNLLTDKGANHIAAILRSHPHIKRVELAGNPDISDECLRKLQIEFHERFANSKGLQRLAINPHRRSKPVLEAPNLNQTSFLADFYDKNQPVVVRNAITHTPAVQTWSPDYFGHLMKEKESVLSIIDMEEHSKHLPYTIKHIPLKMHALVSQLTANESINSLTKRLYVLKSNLDELPEIKDDITLPDFSQALNHMEHSAHLWIGQSDTHTSLHFDEYDNIFLQIYGEKSILLFPPKDSPFLNPCKPNKETGLRNIHRSHISCTDMLDHVNHPSNRTTPYHVHVQPGDALYIPKGWWHEVRGLSKPTISVNYWFLKQVEGNPYIDTLFSQKSWLKSSLTEKQNAINEASKRLIQINNPNYVSVKIPFTLLQIAIQFNLIEAVERLLEHEKTELKLAPYACTPLFLSIAFGHLNIMRLLLKNPNIACLINQPFEGYGYTPLTLAAEHGHLEILNELVRMGAHRLKKDNLNQTAFEVAIKYKHTNCALFLANDSHLTSMVLNDVVKQMHTPS